MCWASRLQGLHHRPRSPWQSWVMPLVSAQEGKDPPAASGSGRKATRRISRIPSMARFPPSLIFTSTMTHPPPPIPLPSEDWHPKPSQPTGVGGKTLVSWGPSVPLPAHPRPPCFPFPGGCRGSTHPHSKTTPNRRPHTNPLCFPWWRHASWGGGCCRPFPHAGAQAEQGTRTWRL